MNEWMTVIGSCAIALLTGWLLFYRGLRSACLACQTPPTSPIAAGGRLTPPPLCQAAEYGLVESFGVDNGELDGLAAHECFTLGYELALVHADLDKPEAFTRTVRVENRERIERAAEKRNRRISLTYMHADASESWLHLQAEQAPDV